MKINIDKIEKLEFQMFVLDELAEKMENDGNDVIKLTLGKSPEQLNPKIIKKYHEAIDDINIRNSVYPQGLPILRQAIADWYSSIGDEISIESIIINTGTSPFFKDLMSLLVQDGDDEVLMPNPYYSVYYVSSVLAGAKVKFYDIDEDTLTLNKESFKNNYNPDKTKLVILCSPGNPYGNLLTKNDLKFILKETKLATYILSDEIYRNVSFNENNPSLLSVSNKNDKKRIIISNSFSKGFRMYTSRVGFIILPTILMKYFRVLLQHTLLTTNPVEQYAALEAIKNRKDVLEIKNLYFKRNDFIFNKFKPISKVKAIKAQGGFYCVLNCDGFMNYKNINGSLSLAKDILKKTGVAVVPGSDFGIDRCIRISFTNARFEEAIIRLTEYFKT